MAKLSRGFKRRTGVGVRKKNPARIRAAAVQPKRVRKNPAVSFVTKAGKTVSFGAKKHARKNPVAKRRVTVARKNPVAKRRVTAARKNPANAFGGFKVSTARSVSGPWTHRATMPSAAAAKDLAQMYHRAHGVAVRVTR